MKKLISTLFLGLVINFSYSQEVNEALQFAQPNYTGTARFSATGGAFGALGGDFSALNINPAGSSVFNYNQSSVTFSNYSLRNTTNYFGSKNIDSNNTFDINQVGAVWIFNNDDNKSNWKKIALAVNYENANNFHDFYYTSGTNPLNSGANYFTTFANQNGGIALGTLENGYYDELNFEDQQAFLGYQAFIINPASNNANNKVYTSNVPSGGNYFQESRLSSSGYNGKLIFNTSAQYKDFLYLGMSLNSHFSDYRKNTVFRESNQNSTTDGIKSMQFENELHTYGNGFSFQLGAIAKVTKSFRAGLSYESPTWTSLNDELNQNLNTSGYNFGTPPNPNLSNRNPDSNFTVVYKAYSLRTPGKFSGSLAYVFNKSGFLSFDYAIKDYSNIKYGTQNDFRNPEVNVQIANLLTTTNAFRVGGEYKIKQFSLRGGYAYEDSPYKNKKTIGETNSYSGGLGYSFETVKIDLSYTLSRRNSQKTLLNVGLPDFSTISSRNDNVALTLVFNL